MTVNNFVFYERSVVEDKKFKSTKIRKYFTMATNFFLNIFFPILCENNNETMSTSGGLTNELFTTS